MREGLARGQLIPVVDCVGTECSCKNFERLGSR